MLLMAANPAPARHTLEPGEDPVATCKWRAIDVQRKLDSVILKYGADSKQAIKVRGRFADMHEWCWDRYRGWWDEKTSTWHTEEPPSK